VSFYSICSFISSASELYVFALCSTLEDLHLAASPLGALLAAVSVAASGMQQIMVRWLQQQHGLTASQLLGQTAPVQAFSLIIMGPAVDKLVTGQWAHNFIWTQPALTALAVSCLLAVAVNASQFACLGKISAASFQVLGHAKTVLVLVGSWLLMMEPLSPKKAIGGALAVTGMILYNYVSREKPVQDGGTGTSVSPFKKPTPEEAHQADHDKTASK
jgi:uncharacterized membrane protein